MTIKYAAFIRDLRQKRGFSQSDIAIKLGMSRPSYISVEQGKRELTLSEAETLANLLGVTLKEMESGVTMNYEKYKQMIFAYLRSKPDFREGVPKTKLAKLLYLADFAWFYNHFESMSGMQYRKIQYGPVPDTYFRAIEELFEEGKIAITPTQEGAMLISETRSGEKVALSEINKDEEALIQTISKKWQDKRTQEIVDFTHNQFPFLLAKDDEIVSYSAITQENSEDVY